MKNKFSNLNAVTLMICSKLEQKKMLHVRNEKSGKTRSFVMLLLE